MQLIYGVGEEGVGEWKREGGMEVGMKREAVGGGKRGDPPNSVIYAPTTHPGSAPYTEGLTDFIGGTPNPPSNIARFHLLETTDLHV